MTRLVFPRIPEALFQKLSSSEILPSTITFVIGAGQVLAPQTGHPWFVEFEHNLACPRFYSLVPEGHHFRIDWRRPRLHCFHFTDAWITTNHHRFCVGDMEIHVAKTFFNPQRADDKLYFDRAPFHRMEILVPDRFIGDREVLEAIRPVIGEEFQIDSLVQRQ